MARVERENFLYPLLFTLYALLYYLPRSEDDHAGAVTTLRARALPRFAMPGEELRTTLTSWKCPGWARSLQVAPGSVVVALRGALCT